MFKLSLLCGALLCASLTAVAQDSVALDTSSPEAEPAAAAPAPASLYPSDRDPWQLEVGFQYQQFAVLKKDFHTLGFHSDVTRFLNTWFAVEGTANVGFDGHTGGNPNLGVRTLLLDGGPHITLNNRTRFEPWVHVLVGLEHIRFTQTSGLGSQSRLGFMAGAGVDYKFGSHASWRLQGDFLGSHFGQPSVDHSFSAGTGLVLNF